MPTRLLCVFLARLSHLESFQVIRELLYRP